MATLVATSGSHYTGVLIALEIDFCAVSVYTPPIFSILCIAFRYVSYSYYFDMYLMVASDMEWKLFWMYKPQGFRFMHPAWPLWQLNVHSPNSGFQWQLCCFRRSQCSWSQPWLLWMQSCSTSHYPNPSTQMVPPPQFTTPKQPLHSTFSSTFSFSHLNQKPLHMNFIIVWQGRPTTLGPTLSRIAISYGCGWWANGATLSCSKGWDAVMIP